MILRSSFFVGRVLVTPSRNVIASGGSESNLEPRLMDILLLLASRPGEVVTRKDLLEAGWPGAASADEGLTKAVSLLRHALGDAASSSIVIQTIPKRGYRLVAPLRSADHPRSSGAERWSTGPARLDQTTPPVGRARGARVAGTAVVILLALVAGFAGGMRRTTAGEPVRKQFLIIDTASTSDHLLDGAGKPVVIKRRIKLAPSDHPTNPSAAGSDALESPPRTSR
ncbi:MAG TPA: transcriptional regulator [Rhodothermales bacterium]|nr:transcriptional regulator [Rhodothermales bacterium]